MKNKDTLYSQLMDSLLEEIRQMKVGDKIPSERQLCQIYDVSRTTVRNAIIELEHNGYVTRIQGKGTFIQNPKKNRQNLSNYYSFTEATKQRGKIPKSLILEYHIERASEDIAEILHLENHELVIQIVRLRLADDEPMLLETTYIKYDDFPEITKKLLEEYPLYDIFEMKYQRKVHKVTESFFVTFVNAKQSSLLAIKANSPCLKIIRYSYDLEDHLIEYTESFAPGDKFNYETTYYPN